MKELMCSILTDKYNKQNSTRDALRKYSEERSGKCSYNGCDNEPYSKIAIQEDHSITLEFCELHFNGLRNYCNENY